MERHERGQSYTSDVAGAEVLSEMADTMARDLQHRAQQVLGNLLAEDGGRPTGESVPTEELGSMRDNTGEETNPESHDSDKENRDPSEGN